MRELFAKLETNNITAEEISRLEDADLILYYDGYRITKWGWLYLLRGTVPEREIIDCIFGSDKKDYQESVIKLKENGL